MAVLRRMMFDSPQMVTATPSYILTYQSRLRHLQAPSDRRIKKDFQPVDTADLLHRLQRVRITEYGYTDEWRAVRGIPDKRVRGVIAQELNEIFPEHISVLETYSLPDKGFQKTRFYRVDKQRLALDVIGGLQALHDRYSIGESTSSESGSLALTTKAAPSSGAIYLQTGRASSVRAGTFSYRVGPPQAAIAALFHS